jgi:hypothetical protein
MLEKHEILEMFEKLLEALQDVNTSASVTSLIEDALDEFEEETASEEE